MGRIEKKNGFESYCVQMKNTLNDDKLKDKFTDDDKKLIQEESDQGLKFCESNPDADASEYEAKQKEIEAKFNPIMMRIYQAGGAQGAPNIQSKLNLLLLMTLTDTVNE